MTDTFNPQQVLQTQRTLPFNAEEIYAAFAEPNRLAQWWGPEGFTNTFEVFEFTLNGNWRFVMHGPDGADYPNQCIFQELEPAKKIVIRHSCEPYFTLNVFLEQEPTGTEVFWQQVFDDASVAEAVRPIVEPCNEQNLDRLLRHLRGD